MEDHEMNVENIDIEQSLLDEKALNSGTSPYVATAVGRLTFIVTGDSFKAEASPWDFLCSGSVKPALYNPTESDEEKLEMELRAWDAASDEIHGD
jgi:hypothetical protein